MYMDEYHDSMEQNLVTALVNGDVTGLSESEDGALEKFLESLNERAMSEHGPSAFAAIVKPEEDTAFQICDVTGLKGECHGIIALVYQMH